MWLERVLVVAVVLAVMLLMGSAFEPLRTPVALLVGGGVALLLTLVDRRTLPTVDRRTAVLIAVPMVIVVALLGWALTQPTYLSL